MSIHVDDLRSTCGLLGELAADEIEAMEKENAELRARLSASPAAQEGYVMVPREPTEAMQYAYHNGPTSTHQRFRERYRNMLTALPATRAQDEAGDDAEFRQAVMASVERSEQNAAPQEADIGERPPAQCGKQSDLSPAVAAPPTQRGAEEAVQEMEAGWLRVADSGIKHFKERADDLQAQLTALQQASETMCVGYEQEADRMTLLNLELRKASEGRERDAERMRGALEKIAQSS